MASRIAMLLVTGFWLVMTTLLWRSEFGNHKPFGSTVPMSLVWDRVLTAPDGSTLEIRHGTNVIGHCQVRADLGQEIATGARYEESEEGLEGMVQHLAYYRLDIDGAVALPDLPQRAKFNFAIKLDTNRVWQQFTLKINLRPDIYELTGDAARQMVHLRVDAGGDQFERSFSFVELRNPQRLLAEIGGPALPLLLGLAGPRATAPGSTNLLASLGMRWEAHNDALLFGKHRLRSYRMKATVWNRYRANVYVSPVGEILRVELPDNIVLVNNAVAALRRAP